MAKLNKLTKVNESVTINRYDNGWMVEVGGRDSDNEWKNCKIVCNTEAEVLDVVKEYNSMDLDN
jgi:hypothetical protein